MAGYIAYRYETVNREAWQKGFDSNAQMSRAAAVGITTKSEFLEHERKRVEIEREKAADFERRKHEADAERERRCQEEIQCWGDKHHIQATFACRGLVERLATFQHEWTDGWTDVKFQRFRWHNKDKRQITYIGDNVKFQNGFGAWQRHIYSCDFDTVTGIALRANAWPGRLPVQ